MSHTAMIEDTNVSLVVRGVIVPIIIIIIWHNNNCAISLVYNRDNKNTRGHLVEYKMIIDGQLT